MSRRAATAAAGLLAVALLAGCANIGAQNPPTALRPVNAVADDGGARLMLRGHDVVAYFTQGRPVPGSPQHASVHEGVGLRFASAEHKAMFDADPKRYLPQYGGFCATGIAYAIPWGGSPETWRIADGKLYIFGGQGSKDAFELDVPANTALADRYWAEEVAGRHSFVQRVKRLVLRVPHYQSDAELARLVAQAKAKQP